MILSIGSAKTLMHDLQPLGNLSFLPMSEKGAITLNSDFKELLNLLNEAQAKDLVVGGYAVIEYTEPRYTKDLDIWVSPERNNAERVYTALKQFGAPLANITIEDFTNPNLVYYLGRPPVRVDILMGLTGLEFERSWSNRVEGNYGEIQTQFISIEDLIITKSKAGRPQDIIDVENLRLTLKRKESSEPAKVSEPEQKPVRKKGKNRKTNPNESGI